MSAEITPQPRPEERDAIAAALEHLLAESSPAAYRSRWRESGLRENVEAGFEPQTPAEPLPDPGAGAPRRSRAGATRA